jgi:hypothetical protein
MAWLDDDPVALAAEEEYQKNRQKPNRVDQTSRGISTDDFYAYMPMHNYVYVPTRST